ncbi:MAG: bacterial transcriptional activator domain-containing protein, partial [Actinomycetota bacterium]|nr:bacterial transcriptional activator domain-containing protein [Actinomycetota bacterium]
EAIWPGEDVETSRNRLRNVLLRLRKAAGDVLIRTANGVRMAPGVSCDLDDFNRLAHDAASVLRADPDLAGHLARQAIEVGEGPLFAEFEYEEWAAEARRSTETKLIELFDLLSIQAEDVGDFAAASRYAEGALRFDRYSDSRHRRQADLYVLQGRHAAAAAALEMAAAVARELDRDHALVDEDDLRGFADPIPKTRQQ